MIIRPDRAMKRAKLGWLDVVRLVRLRKTYVRLYIARARHQVSLCPFDVFCSLFVSTDSEHRLLSDVSSPGILILGLQRLACVAAIHERRGGVNLFLLNVNVYPDMTPLGKEEM